MGGVGKRSGAGHTAVRRSVRSATYVERSRRRDATRDARVRASLLGREARRQLATADVSSPRRVLLRAGFVLPDAGAEAIADGAVVIEDGRTASLGRFSALRRAYPLAAERGGGDLVALPAL